LLVILVVISPKLALLIIPLIFAPSLIFKVTLDFPLINSRSLLAPAFASLCEPVKLKVAFLTPFSTCIKGLS